MLIILFAVLLSVVVAKEKLVFKEDGTFKILHISDVHYEVPSVFCDDILLSQLPCDEKNSTALLSWLIETEKPDLIVHTGDIIDWATIPATRGMTEYYNVSYSHNVPWAASLGNHDDDSPTMTNREKVLNYIIGLPGTLTEMGPVEKTYGNFILEIFPTADAELPAFRTYHFDSDSRTEESITTEQVAWFKAQSQALNKVAAAPALAFQHIPLQEYQTAIDSGIPISGEYHEGVCYQPSNTGLFQAFKDTGDVKATFSGHDHTNDFCALYEGVQLCYEGSPSFQAYGSTSVPRRARVTEIRAFGDEIVSWKRLDMSTGNGAVFNKETLWYNENSKEKIVPLKVERVAITSEYANKMQKRMQKHRRH